MLIGGLRGVATRLTLVARAPGRLAGDGERQAHQHRRRDALPHAEDAGPGGGHGLDRGRGDVHGRGLGLLRSYRDRALPRATVRGVHRHGGRWRHGRSRLQAVSDPCRGEGEPRPPRHGDGLVRHTSSAQPRPPELSSRGRRHQVQRLPHGRRVEYVGKRRRLGGAFPGRAGRGAPGAGGPPGGFSHPRREHSRRPGGARTAHQGRRPHLSVRPPHDRPALHPAVAPRGVGPRRGRPRLGAQGGRNHPDGLRGDDEPPHTVEPLEGKG